MQGVNLGTDGDGSAGYLMDVDIFRMPLGWFNDSSGDAVLYEMSIRFGGETGTGKMKWATAILGFVLEFREFRQHKRGMHKQSKLAFHLYPVSNAVATASLQHSI